SWRVRLPGGGRAGLVRRLDVHFCARHKAQLSIRHHCFSRLHPAFHHRFTVAGNARADRPRLHGLVRLHHVNKLAILPCLHRWGRHNNRVRLGRERHRDLDELSRPQRIVFVGKGGLELDHSRRRIEVNSTFSSAFVIAAWSPRTVPLSVSRLARALSNSSCEIKAESRSFFSRSNSMRAFSSSASSRARLALA